MPYRYTHLKAYTVCLNLFSFSCARKWGMAFINCFTHDFLLWQESELISKCQTSHLCLVIIYAKLFHMFRTKKKKSSIKNIHYWKVTKKWEVVIIQSFKILDLSRSLSLRCLGCSDVTHCCRSISGFLSVCTAYIQQSVDLLCAWSCNL